jgi:hypothetical protein
MIIIYFFYIYITKEPFTTLPFAPFSPFKTNAPSQTQSEYYPISSFNPLGNVLVNEIKEEPGRKPAPPAFDPPVKEVIDKRTKESIKKLNKGIPTEEVFTGIGNKIEFDNFMWNFYSTPATQIPNDQGAFGDYLYGNMPSAKENTPEGIIKAGIDNERYIPI